MKILNIIKYLFIIFIFLLLIILIYNNIDINVCYKDNLDSIIDCCNEEYKHINKENVFKSQFNKYDNKNLCNKYITSHEKFNKYNDSIILAQVKDLHFKNAVHKQDAYNKILELEKQIHKDKIAYCKLIKDIDIIIKEFKSV